MGAWGAGSFENDDALDFVGDLADGGDVAQLRAALEAIPREGYIEAMDATNALAAAEIVAAAHGRPGPDLPEAMTAWVAKHRANVNAKMLTFARDVVKRITEDEQSELRELWAESDSFAEWKAAVDGLLKRL